MLTRFSAAAAVASAAIALGAIFVVWIPFVEPQFPARITRVWCFIPAAWGLWAVVIPRGWLPARLPLWGAVLGLLLGLLLVIVLDLPSKAAGLQVPLAGRALSVGFIAAFYYLLWMLVRAAYRALAPRSSAI